MEKKKSNRYEKDRELLGRQGVDLSKLDALEDLIASGQRIPDTHKPHKFKDSKHYKKCLECHVTSPTDDWIVIYKFGTINGNKVVGFVRTGSHSRLLKESLKRRIDHVKYCLEHHLRISLKERRILEENGFYIKAGHVEYKKPS